VLFNDSTIHQGTRKHLIEKYNLKKIILMSDSFFMNTNVKCAVLYWANEEEKTSQVEYYDIKYIDNKIQETHLLTVDVKKIKANDYYLGINKYTEKEETKFNGVEYKKLGEICELKNGYAFKSENFVNSGIGLISIKTIQENIVDNNKITDFIVENKKYIDYLVKKNDILIALSGATTGKIGIYQSLTPGYLNQRVCKMIFTNKNIIDKYVYYWFLEYNITNVILKQSKGSAQPNISTKDIENLEIPIPSLELQQQIVDVLDGYYSQIESNRKSIQSYESFKKAVVWGCTINCQTKKLGDVFKTIKTGKNKPQDNKMGTLYPYYGTGDITGYTDEYLVDGKYILTARNGTIGNIMLIEGKSFPSDHMFILKDTNENINFLFFCIKYLCKLEDHAHGTTIKGITKTNLESSNIPIPSKEVQESIVKECEYWDEQIERLKTQNEMLESNEIIQKVLSSIEQMNTNIVDEEKPIYQDDIEKFANIIESAEEELEEAVKPKKKSTKKTKSKEI